MSTRRARPASALRSAPVLTDPDAVIPATRHETLRVAIGAIIAGFLALSLSALHGDMLLYGDAVAHLGIARGILDTNAPGLGTLGGVWLPLPHLLMLPFIWKMAWWQDGMAGAWPSLACYIVGVMGIYRLSRRLLAPRWALVATAFFGLNANLLYLATTAMTEPLFLALFVWMVLLTLELVDAVGRANFGVVRSRLLLVGLLIFAATMTRYDGWVLGAAVWCVVAWVLLKMPAEQAGSRKAARARGSVWPVFAVFTVLAVAGPLLWFGYNHVFGHDWLDFMRGPYSAKEIDRKTSPPGAHKYWGWHNPAWSLMLYARTAQVDAAWWETGWLVAAGALWGTWKALKLRLSNVWLLLWLPLPFYVYSISYGSVPIFIPQLYPHSFYNSRYGMEMLPVLALFGTYALVLPVGRLGAVRPLAVRFVQPVALMLVVLNLVLMVHATPLVLKEAMVNSRGRLALEQPLAQQLMTFLPGSVILVENSEHVGALQTAGIPLKQTIGPSDYYRWRDAMRAPAETANYVVAVAGDDIAKAVARHPEGLTELTILCSTNQPCVRVYQSDRFHR